MACLYGTIKDYKWGKMGKRLWVCVLGVLPFLLCLHVGMREEDKKSLTCLVCRLLIFFFPFDFSSPQLGKPINYSCNSKT